MAPKPENGLKGAECSLDLYDLKFKILFERPYWPLIT